jgi:Putative auto-transporter adhesin, head GIN domain
MKRSTAALLVGLGSIVAVLLLVALWVRFTSTGKALPSLSGQRATRSYDLSGFTQVKASGQWQVTLVRGDEWAVEVSYPAELESGVDVRQERGALALRYTLERSWWSDFGSNDSLAMNARIVMPALEAVEMHGASSLDFSGFAGERLAIDASGAVAIDGRDSRYGALGLKISGAGRADLGGVTTTAARIDVSGVQTVTLRMAGGPLSGGVSGVSRVDYSGTVSSQDVRASGVSRVEHRP